MQRGSLIKKNHKQGPDVWQFRWSEKSPEGRRVYRKRVIGTVEQYPSEDAARRAVVGLVAEINSGDRSMYSNSMTVSQLSDHFEQRELGRDNTWRSYATKKSYHTYLKRWIVPHWGEYGLFEIRTVEVESWLRPFTVGQEQLREAPKFDVCATVDIYAQAITPAEHAAQAAVVSLMFPPGSSSAAVSDSAENRT
jgi:hypothetical protein